MTWHMSWVWSRVYACLWQLIKCLSLNYDICHLDINQYIITCQCLYQIMTPLREQKSCFPWPLMWCNGEYICVLVVFSLCSGQAVVLTVITHHNRGCVWVLFSGCKEYLQGETPALTHTFLSIIKTPDIPFTESQQLELFMHDMMRYAFANTVRLNY